MENPLSLSHFYLRNKRKIVPVVGILALAILGVVVTDSLLASARETAYATFGSYQKLILVAPRPTRDQDLARPLEDSLARLRAVQSEVDGLNEASGLSAYTEAVAQIPIQVRAQLPVLDRLQQNAAAARTYAGRLRGDLVPLAQLITRVQRLESEEQAVTQLEHQLAQNPRDPTPLITYLREHQTFLHSVLPDATDLGRLQQAVGAAAEDALGLERALSALSRDSAELDTRGRNLPELPPPPNVDETLAPFRSALDRLGQSLGSIEQPLPDLDPLLAASQRIPGTAFVWRDAYSNLDINLLAGNAQFDLYGLNPAEMTALLDLYGDRLKAGRLPHPNANEIALSQEIARSRNVSIGGQVGNNLDELDRLPDAFTVVGIVEGPTRLGLIPFDYMTSHYLFERRYQSLVVVPEPGREAQVRQQLTGLIGDKPFRLFDWAYIKGKIDSLIANLDTINRFLILLVTIVLSLVVGLLNVLFFRQRMNEFGLLAAIGYSRGSLILRVGWESFGVVIAAWLIGVGLGAAVLEWFNQVFMVPHGLLLNVFNWNVLVTHTLPIPLMVFVFGMGTVAWQLLRMDPISIIERRD